MQHVLDLKTQIHTKQEIKHLTLTYVFAKTKIKSISICQTYIERRDF